MTGWGSGLSVTPMLLVTSHQGHSLDCVSDAETSGFPDFPQHFFPFTSHFSFPRRQRRGERITEMRAGWKSAGGRGGRSCIIVSFIHRALPFIGHSVTSKMTNMAYRHFDARVIFFNAYVALQVGEQAEEMHLAPGVARMLFVAWAALFLVGMEAHHHGHTSSPSNKCLKCSLMVFSDRIQDG